MLKYAILWFFVAGIVGPLGWWAFKRIRIPKLWGKPPIEDPPGTED
jgi:hypothetical protein